MQKQAEEKLAPKKSKFSSVKTIIDGHAFDSKKEAKYYSELKMREKAGEIYFKTVFPITGKDTEKSSILQILNISMLWKINMLS